MFVTVGRERIMLHQIVRWAPGDDGAQSTRVRVLGSSEAGCTAYDMTLPVEPVVFDRMVLDAAVGP